MFSKAKIKRFAFSDKLVAEPETQSEGLKIELQLPKNQRHPEQASGCSTGLAKELHCSAVVTGGVSRVTFVQLSPSLASWPFTFPSTDGQQQGPTLCVDKLQIQPLFL